MSKSPHMPDFIREQILLRGLDPDRVVECELDWEKGRGHELRIKLADAVESIDITFA